MMATHGWRKAQPVESWLFEEGHRFDFYQAVRLLEMLRPDAIPVGEGSEPGREAVRFNSRVRMDFPPTDVDEVRRPAEVGRPAEMAVNFMGLAGGFGPLPAPFAELILERVWNKDTALRDFLDIFNQRLLSLMYRIRKKHRIGLDTRPPEEGHFAHYLYALMGLGTNGLRGRLNIRDRAFLFYTGLLMQQPCSPVGLEAILKDYFEVEVKVRSFCGQWYPLEEDQVTAIGPSGQNQLLGQGAVLGGRVWDQHGKFEICLGPLVLEQFLDFLPSGWGFRPLCELTQFYVGGEFDFDIELRLKASEVPELRLGSAGKPRLGWTTRLKPGVLKGEVCVRLSPGFRPLNTQHIRFPLFANLPLDELSEVVGKMVVHRFPRNSVVVHQGDPSSSLFLISSGVVNVILRDAEGKERVLATLREGFFGEMGFLTEKPRIATVVTVEDSEILELSKQDLEAIIARHPRVERILKAFYESRIREQRGASPSSHW